MSSGSLVDLDPPPARERRWPFYVAWAFGGAAVGAVLLSHLPVPFIHAATVVEPIVTAPPATPVVPVATFVIIQRGPQGTPTRVAPIPAAGPVGPARP